MAATAIATLLGPPEARRPSAAVAAAPATTTGDAFLDLMDANFNKPAPRKALTENLSPTFVSSGTPASTSSSTSCRTPSAAVASLLAAAWGADQATALRLVANLRGVRGTGKSDREGFYAAALWLHSHHPATLALNAASVAAFGYLRTSPSSSTASSMVGCPRGSPGRRRASPPLMASASSPAVAVAVAAAAVASVAVDAVSPAATTPAAGSSRAASVRRRSASRPAWSATGG